MPSTAARTRAPRPKSGERLSALEAKVGALESELKKSERRLKREVGRREHAESELRRSESRFRSLAAFGDHQLFVMDAEGRYLFSSREDGLSVGGDLLKIVSRNQREFHLPEVADLYEAKMNFVLETGLGVEFEHAAPEPDGLHHHLDTLYPIAESGRIVALGGICRDVTGQKDIQHRLGRSEERFRRMFDLGLIGMAITSVDKGWLEVNDRLCGILGFSREELLRKSWAEITHPDDLAADVARFNQVLAGALDAYSMEKRFIRKDGRIIHAEISVRCLRRPDRSVEYFVAFVQDITERKRALEQLRASEQRLQWALDATAEGVWDWNIRTGEVLFSRNWKASLGYSVDEAPDRLEFWESIVHPEDLPRVKHILNEHFEGRSPVYSCENRLRMKSGEYRANLDRGMVVEWDESGKPARMVGTDTDIRAHRKAMDDLRHAKNDLEAIFDASQQAVFLMEPDGTVVGANAETARRLNLRVEDLVGKSVFDFLPADAVGRRKQYAEEAIRTRQPVRFEDSRADRIISQVLYPVFDPQGNVIRLAVYGEDVTEQKLSEASRRESEVKYRLLFENSLDGILMTIPDGTIMDANPAACAMLGMSRDDVCRAGREGIIEHNATLAAGLRERERTGSAKAELTFVRKDGSTFIGETSSVIITDPCGTTRSFVIVRDITERQRAEQALRESEERYRRIVETASEGIWSMDGDYRTTYANRHMADMLGYAPEEMIGRRVDAFMFAEDAEDHSAKMAIRAKGEGGVYERRFRRKDGRELWTFVAATALKDAEGNFAGSFAMFTDVTERKLAEQALLESEVRYRIVADNTYDWECWLSPDGAFRYSSPACERITGYTAGDFLRRAGLMREIVHPDDRMIWDAHRCEAPSDQRAIAIELRIIRADGDTRWIEHICQPVFDPAGKYLGSRASNRDTTERKRGEEVLREYEIMVASSTDAISLVGHDYVYKTVNTTLMGRTGLPRNQIVGRSVAEIMGTDVFEKIIRPRLDRALAGETVTYAEWFEFPALGRRFYDVTYTPCRNHHSESIGVVVVSHDITGRKRGEEALLQYENIVSSSTDAMSLVGCDYVYMTVNNTYLRRTGLAREQIVGKPVAEIMGQAAFDEVIKPRIDQCLAGDSIIYSEWFDFPAEGRRHVEVTYSPCRNRKQEVTGAVVIARDITERKKAEETIAHSEELLKRTQSLARVGGWEWDLQARAMSWTEETYRIHEIAPEEVVPGSAEHIARSLACYDEPDRLRIMDAFRHCAEEGKGYDYEVPFTTAKGRRLWVRTIAEAVWDGGKIAKVAGNLVDVTERKRSEEVLQVRLRLSDAAGKIGMEELLRQALDETERITGSSSGFVHFFDEDQKALSLQMWSTNTLEKLCSAEGQGRHYGLDEAGVWADCIRERRPVVHNDYSALPHRKGMPAGHAPVVRELVVPILRNERIVAVLGVGNKPQEYDQRDVEMVQSLANLAWDIVMRKKAEEQMDLQAMVLDQTSDRVCISDLDGVIGYVNEAESLALKRSRSELIGRHISVFGEDAELGATQQEVIDSTLANGQWRGEVVNFASNGAQSMVALRTFLVRSPSGKAIALCGIGTDITTQRRSEAALRESELFLRETQRIGRMGGWKANPKTDYLKWTDGVYEIIGAPRAYAPGMSEGLEFFLPEYIPLLKRNAEKCLETGEPFTLECQVQTTGGDKLWAEVRGLKSLQESSGSYVIGTFQDIDQRKKYEADLSRSREQMREMYRQLQNSREEERKRISREIHDELGQNITATKIDLAWLRKRIDPSQTALLQKLTSMEAVADATLETVRRVSSELRPGILDALGLAAAVDWLVKDFQVRSEIECRLVIEPEDIEVAPNLATDVFRILQEALTNILRYARASTVEVILKKKEAQIEMQVMDNGIGIAEEKVSQADSLGFLGIRERLHPYGGVLRISGAPGKGTAMIVAIPIS